MSTRSVYAKTSLVDALRVAGRGHSVSKVRQVLPDLCWWTPRGPTCGRGCLRSPGIIVFPLSSTICASAGICTVPLGPTAVMRLSVTHDLVRSGLLRRLS